MERKLTAILSAEVQGYSRLMGDDEESTLRRALTVYHTAIDTLIPRTFGMAALGYLKQCNSAAGSLRFPREGKVSGGESRREGESYATSWLGQRSRSADNCIGVAGW